MSSLASKSKTGSAASQIESQLSKEVDGSDTILLTLVEFHLDDTEDERDKKDNMTLNKCSSEEEATVASEDTAHFSGCLNSRVWNENRALRALPHDGDHCDDGLRGRSSNVSFFNTDWLPASLSPDDCDEPHSPFRALLGFSAEDDEEANDNDNSSVTSAASTAYFEPSDLNPSNWIKAMYSMNAPTFAFGVVALSAAITHPLLFVVAALAAYGTATAAGAGYDYFNKNRPPFSSFCWDINPDAETVTAVLQPCVPAAIEKGKDSDESTAESSASVEPEPSSATEALQQDIIKLEPLDAAETKLAQADNHDLAHRLVELNYPSLEFQLVNDELFIGLSTVEVFKVFFDDNAPYNFIEFQKKRGDVDIVYQPWEPLPGPPAPLFCRGTTVTQQSLFPSDLTPLSYQQRVITFKAKTNSIFGPPYASTTKTQRFLIISKRLAILENKTDLAEIPFSDRFCVVDRWVIQADKHEDCYNSRISASCQAVFTRQCAFEQQIRTKSSATLLEVVSAWCCMAQEALKLAEAAKHDRLRLPSSTLHDDDAGEGNVKLADESVEIEHDGDLGVVTLRRSESDSEIVETQQKVRGFRRSISQITKHKPSFDLRRPRKLSTVW